MNGTAPATRADLTALKFDIIRGETATDGFAEELQLQVVALEECLYARWPRSILVRARLRRDLRASVRHIAEGDGFTGRRVNTIGSGWITRPGSRWARPDC